MEAKIQRAMLVEFVIKCLGLVLAGMLTGAFLAVRLHAQPLRGSGVSQGDRDVIAVTMKVSMMEGTLAELNRKVDALKSEADTTEAMGAGIGLAITFLQILGFFAKSRNNYLDGPRNSG